MARPALVFAALVILGLQAWIRLAPDDPARWHGPSKAHAMALEADEVISCAAAQRRLDRQNPAQAGCWLNLPPAEVLARLDAIAGSSPRTTRLAGAPETGRITWVSRSFFWGFPDYITAEADALGPITRLDLLSRQRYGDGDLGVNAARLKDWLARLASDHSRQISSGGPGGEAPPAVPSAHPP